MSGLFELLSLETGASAETISRILVNAPRRYKVYQIPKRNGGMRTIAHPARELKLLQRIFLHRVLDQIEVSPIATAYISERGILYNAQRHVSSRWLLKLDFKDFFHSLKPTDFDRALRSEGQLQRFISDRMALRNLLFWGVQPRNIEPVCLSIGAPTSPSISNLLCRKMDEWLMEKATKYGVIVTRYADDITVSAGSLRPLIKFEGSFQTALKRATSPKLTLNMEKRGLYGPGERRMVTGLIITPTGEISLGRERKREISSLVHKATLDSLSPTEIMRTKGLLAFAVQVEPTYFRSMQQKYSEGAITKIMKYDGLEESTLFE